MSALAVSDKPVGDASERRRQPLPMRRQSTPASAPGNPFSGPRKARLAVGRLAMPGRPCTPDTGAATDSANAPVDGRRHRFGRGVDQPDYVSPPLPIVWSCFSSRFGGPKGNVLRIPSAIGFNPVAGEIRPLTTGGQAPASACMPRGIRSGCALFDPSSPARSSTWRPRSDPIAPARTTILTDRFLTRGAIGSHEEPVRTHHGTRGSRPRKRCRWEANRHRGCPSWAASDSCPRGPSSRGEGSRTDGVRRGNPVPYRNGHYPVAEHHPAPRAGSGVRLRASDASFGVGATASTSSSVARFPRRD